MFYLKNNKYYTFNNKFCDVKKYFTNGIPKRYINFSGSSINK